MAFEIIKFIYLLTYLLLIDCLIDWLIDDWLIDDIADLLMWNEK